MFGCADCPQDSDLAGALQGDVAEAALMGADIATVPFKVLKKCVEHPLTDRGLDSFLADWEKVKNA